MQNGTKLDQPTAKPRGRPKAYDRTKALHAMREVFWQKGYAATSLDDLCAATGMNRPSLYNAFGEKAQVFKAVLDEYVDETRPRYEKAFTTPGLRPALTAVYETAFDIYKELDPKGLGCFMIGAALTDSVRDPEVANLILSRLHEMDRGFGWLLKRAGAKGELRAGVDRKALTMLASSTHSTLSVRMRAGEPHDDLRRFIGQMVDIICA